MKALPKYLEYLAQNLGPVVKETMRSRIDVEAQNVYEVMQAGTPVSNIRHRHLVDTLIMTKIDDGRNYGYKILYDGYNDKGVPYQLIANTLNKGRPDLAPRRHIYYAIHQLKGMDGRIAEDVEHALSKLKEG